MAFKDKKKGGDKGASGPGGSSSTEIHAPDEKGFEHTISSIEEQIKDIESQLKPIKKLEQDVAAELTQVST